MLLTAHDHRQGHAADEETTAQQKFLASSSSSQRAILPLCCKAWQYCLACKACGKLFHKSVDRCIVLYHPSHLMLAQAADSTVLLEFRKHQSRD